MGTGYLIARRLRTDLPFLASVGGESGSGKDCRCGLHLGLYERRLSWSAACCLAEPGAGMAGGIVTKVEEVENRTRARRLSYLLQVLAK